MASDHHGSVVPSRARSNMVPFDVEQGPPSSPRSPSSSSRPLANGHDEPLSLTERYCSFCFPMDPFRHCPAGVLMWIPSTWRRVQDLTHLTLLVGVISIFVVLVEAVVVVVPMVLQPSNISIPSIILKVLCLVCLVPNVSYYLTVMNQYDEQLQIKQREIAKQKEKLAEAYNTLVNDLDNLLQKAAQSSAGLAERSFESKRRDFQRFLERVRARYSQFGFEGSKVEAKEFFIQFKAFVAHWLAIFKECSLDPDRAPNIVLTQEQLDSCSKIEEIIEVASSQLKQKQVHFISDKREQDAQAIRSTSVQVRRLTRAPDRKAREDGCLGRMTWLQLGNVGWGCRSNYGDYPRYCSLGCMRCVCLSTSHVKLLSFLPANLLLIFFNILAATYKEASPYMVIFFCSNIYCLLVVLLHFEQLDRIEQLQIEIRGLEEMNKSVQIKSDEMHQFYSVVQDLTDMWLHRTVPRLDVMKEMQSYLEDAREGSIIGDMMRANKAIDDLEARLGPVKAWTDRDAISDQAKKTIGTEISQCSRASQFETMIMELTQLTGSGKLALLNG